MNLVIVESPAKAKTIEKILGKDYTVKSCYGHVRDLSKKEMSIDIDKNFEPKYEILADKKNVIAELKKIAKKSDLIWLATDEDREGESISWHLKETLKLKDENIKRIAFHEITKSAILNAINNPRTINEDLVKSQQARRILDRLVGFAISPILWRKVKPSLSAGRVQSVTVKLIVERERERDEFQEKSFYRVKSEFEFEGKIIKSELSQKFSELEEVKLFLEGCKNSVFKVKKTEKKPSKRSPSPPFITSTLQQEASIKLGFSVNQTMSVAQKLYEAGKITYMRTDSVNLSTEAIQSAANVIINDYGDKYLKSRNFSTKSKGAQEAHEAIRPTNFNQKVASENNFEQKLYSLIYKRAIASQMSEAEIENTSITIEISNNKLNFISKGKIIKFDGFLKIYMESKEEDTYILPNVKKGDVLNMNQIEAIQRFELPPARYTEASLVKKLEDLGIGRPSTYAPIISTIQKRGYVVKDNREGEQRNYNYLKLINNTITEIIKTEISGVEKQKLFPMDIGIIVNDFLNQNFKRILKYNFTASVEEEFDQIAQGNLIWHKMIYNFYNPFHKEIEEAKNNSERVKGERLLGKDPKSGKSVFSRLGKFGPIVQIGDSQDEEKPKFASLLKTQSINTITLEEALELFKLPREIGVYEKKEVVASVGRFGPYIRYDSKFISIKPKEGDDPLTINLERAIELIKNKQEEDKNKFINEFKDTNDEIIQVLNGRYGPYIKKGKLNYKIPKNEVPTELTLEKCLELISEQDIKKKTTKKKLK